MLISAISMPRAYRRTDLLAIACSMPFLSLALIAKPKPLTALAATGSPSALQAQPKLF
jgi:uncharacterized MnhB-related membrane protein